MLDMWSRREKVMAIVLASVVICLGVVLLANRQPSVDPMEQALRQVNADANKKTDKPDKKADKKVIVDIKGAVHKPGIYEFDENTRIYTAIKEAGGVRENADTKQINLAQPLSDAMVLYAPQEGEDLQLMQDGARKSAMAKVNINTASERELQQLPGIGEAKARMIVQRREELGKFNTVEDLKKVSGVSDRTISKFREQVICK